jgi:ketosteroid isomerase-like protein
MSRANVEIVRALHAAPRTDLARLYRDERRWAAASAVLSAYFAQDFKCVAVGYLEAAGESFEGLAGLRYVWLEWLTLWQSYRTEVEEITDLGDAVLVLVRDFGRRAVNAPEVAVSSAAIWTVGDGKVTQITCYADRAKALTDLGLAREGGSLDS